MKTHDQNHNLLSLKCDGQRTIKAQIPTRGPTTSTEPLPVTLFREIQCTADPKHLSLTGRKHAWVYHVVNRANSAEYYVGQAHLLVAYMFTSPFCEVESCSLFTDHFTIYSLESSKYV